MAGIVSRDLETEEEGEVARRQSARHVSLKREKKRRGGEGEEKKKPLTAIVKS